MAYNPTVWTRGDIVSSGRLNHIENGIVEAHNGVAVVNTKIDQKVEQLEAMIGSPLVASTVAEMVDDERVYVYVGNETGYTFGNWYYFDGEAWVSGGVYNSTAFVTDPTLEVEGMAADAKATGDEISQIKEDFTEYNAFDVLLNVAKTDRSNQGITFNWETQNTCKVTGTASAQSTCPIYNNTAIFPTWLKKGKTYRALYAGTNVTAKVWFYKNGTYQSGYTLTGDALINVPSDSTGLVIRLQVENGVSVNETVTFAIVNTYSNGELANLYENVNNRFFTIQVQDNTNLNDLTTTGTYIVPSSYNIANRPITATCLLEVYGQANGYTVQRYSTLTFTGRIYVRRKTNGASGTWSEWVNVGNAEQLADNTDLNDVVQLGCYIVPSSYTIANRPSATTSLLEVASYNGSYIVQRYTTLGSTVQVYVRRKANNAWSEWAESGNVYNYEINNYQNNVNVTATPTIAIDAEYYLEESDDPTDDRTAEILALLSTNGYCKLGKGTFVVSGLVMPDYSKLEGSGFGTVLALPESVSSGFVVSVRNYCLLSNTKIYGGSSSYISQSAIGTRHGIIFQGSVGQDGTPVNVPRNSCINNVWIENFSGAGLLCQYTGTASIAALTVNDIWVNGCFAGIDIFRRSEYSHFTNCKVLSNHYGLINNGGNNFFVNCDFSRNVTGVLMDNSDGEAYNNTHGSMVGCSINHNDSNNGFAVIIKNMTNGFVFDGCNIFFGKVDISESQGIEFANMNIGSMYRVTIENSKCILFLGSMFNAAPTFDITNSDGVIVNNCYLRGTGEVINIT